MALFISTTPSVAMQHEKSKIRTIFLFGTYQRSVLHSSGYQKNYIRIKRWYQNYFITFLKFSTSPYGRGFPIDALFASLILDSVKVWNLKSSTAVQTLQGHEGSVLCLEYDNSHLVTGSSDRTIRVWKVPPSHNEAKVDSSERYETVSVLHGHAEGVLNLRMDAAQSRIVSCSKDTSIRVWDWKTGTCIQTLSGHMAAVNAVQYRHDLVVSASGDRTLKIWDTRMRNGSSPSDSMDSTPIRDKMLRNLGAAGDTVGCIATFEGHSRGIACVAFDGVHVVSGSSDQSIRIWDLRMAGGSSKTPWSPPISGVGISALPHVNSTGSPPTSRSCIRVVTGHTDLVRTVQFSSADDILVSGSYDTTVRLWSFSTGAPLSSLNLPANVLNVQWVPGCVYAASQDRDIVEWNFSRNVDLIGMQP
jgi:WD40 repeat protein